MPDTVTKPAPNPPLDDETAAALTLFNTYLAADRERQEHERAIRKAEKTKDDAAAAVRKLNDRKAPATETAAAETAYREAVETLKRVRDGETGVGSGEDETGSSNEAADGGDATDEAAEDTDDADDTPEAGEEAASVGVEAPVGDDDLAGDEPASVTG